MLLSTMTKAFFACFEHLRLANIARADPPTVPLETSRKRMEFLNDENARQQESLLTRAEVEEAHSLPKGWVAYKICQSLGNVWCSTKALSSPLTPPPITWQASPRGEESCGRQGPLRLIRSEHPDSRAFRGPDGKRYCLRSSDRIKDKVPGMGTIMDWSSEQIGEQIAQDILRLSHTTTDLYCRAKALENIRKKEVEPLFKMDRSTTEAFLRAFIHIDLGDELVWSHEQWAFTSSRWAMQEEVRNALTDGLEGNDLPDVLALLPDEIADPEPKPYSGPAPTQ
nr:serine/arginine repetitive matrix protein 2-like [Ipomoea batatas]